MILTYTETCYTALKYFFEIEYFCVINKHVVIQHLLKSSLMETIYKLFFFCIKLSLENPDRFSFFFFIMVVGYLQTVPEKYLQPLSGV